jgi:hypothetical protein
MHRADIARFVREAAGQGVAARLEGEIASLVLPVGPLHRHVADRAGERALAQAPVEDLGDDLVVVVQRVTPLEGEDAVVRRTGQWNAEDLEVLGAPIPNIQRAMELEAIGHGLGLRGAGGTRDQHERTAE